MFANYTEIYSAENYNVRPYTTLHTFLMAFKIVATVAPFLLHFCIIFFIDAIVLVLNIAEILLAARP